MGVPVSFILIAVGAILAFAVHQDPNQPVDIDVVGWVLLLVGLFGLLLSLLLWDRWGPGQFGWHRGYAAAPPPSAGYAPRRRTVVEEEEGPAPGVPPPGPPP